MDNLDDLSQFLVSRRAKLTLKQVGLPDFGGRRRVPGLRREEVALLAGMGIEFLSLGLALIPLGLFALAVQRGSVPGGSSFRWPSPPGLWSTSRVCTPRSRAYFWASWPQ
jgi:hypothetical protein